MEFEYDEQKSLLNEKKHGISLTEARELWSVPRVEMPARAVDEARFITVGKLRGKFYSCIFTIRGPRIRLISARRSRVEEERDYHETIDEN
jgi:uncharacterized protein